MRLELGVSVKSELLAGMDIARDRGRMCVDVCVVAHTHRDTHRRTSAHTHTDVDKDTYFQLLAA